MDGEMWDCGGRRLSSSGIDFFVCPYILSFYLNAQFIQFFLKFVFRFQNSR